MDTKVKAKRGQHPNTLESLKKNQIKPGQVLNPHGRNADPPELKAIKKFTVEYLRDLVEIALTGNLSELRAIVNDPEAPAIKVGVAKVLADAIVNGDWNKIELVLARIIGKVPDRVQTDITSQGQSIAQGLTINFVEPKK